MSCPVLHGKSNSHPKVDEIMTQFTKLLPSCNTEHRELEECRRKVAEQSSLGRRLWALGFGTADCVGLAQNWSECYKTRTKLSTQIMQECSPNGHTAMVSEFNVCVAQAETPEQVTACGAGLDAFLNCAQKLAAQPPQIMDD
eukprot:m.165807 g.165807  ORF g.165807 m.165807 type:complete len:142 (+) comp14435_c0_seq2:1257-1682(+)